MATTKNKQQTKSVATTKSQVPANKGTDLRERMRRDAGRGVSTKASDNLVPLVQVLQPLSPQVLRKNQNYINGANPGDFLIKTMPEPIISGEEGFYFQPAGMYQEWVEWVPRDQGGGFVNRYDYNGGTPPKGSKEKPHDPESRRPQGYSMGKNDLIDTRYVPGYMWQDGQSTPLVIPFTSTGHAVARGWMTKQTHLQQEGGILPAFSAVYHVTTKGAKNNKGEWFKVEIGPPILLVDMETGAPNADAEEIVGDCDNAYTLGETLNTAFEKQEKQAHFTSRDDVETNEDTSTSKM
jgi:hypothetical protein